VFAEPGVPGSESYAIELQWVNNSTNEDGFYVYRRDPATSEEFELLDRLWPGTNRYVDVLSQPPYHEAQYCYFLTVFTHNPWAELFLRESITESAPSNTSCSQYNPVHAWPGPTTDEDGDGCDDEYDRCPRQAGPASTNFCPDDDHDGWADVDSDDGVYAFRIELPMRYTAYCPQYYVDCGPGEGIPYPMRAQVHMCLVRQGVPENQVASRCANPEMVLPWPMVP
jgi:hypothetical protein